MALFQILIGFLAGAAVGLLFGWAWRARHAHREMAVADARQLGRVMKLEQDLTRTTGLLERQSAQIATAEAQLDDRTRKLHVAERKGTEVTSMLRQADQKIVAIQHELDSMTIELEEKSEAINLLYSKVEEAESRARKLGGERDRLTEEVAMLSELRSQEHATMVERDHEIVRLRRKLHDADRAVSRSVLRDVMQLPGRNGGHSFRRNGNDEPARPPETP